MEKAQFSEKEYEISASIELAMTGRGPFAPAQTIEYFLGFDAASAPNKFHSIWRILSVHIPRGITLSPSLWPNLPHQFHNQIPGRICSLFLQFKRPIFQNDKRAKYHSKIGGQYFEVQFNGQQQSTLLDLEKRLGKDAIVRYGSPAFWSREEFERHDSSRNVLESSAFVSPSRVKVHRKWMYSGTAGKVILNPEPEDHDSENWSFVVSELSTVAKMQTLGQHVRALANRFRDDYFVGLQPRSTAENSWIARLLQYSQITVEDQNFLSDLSVVTRAAAETGTVWFAMLFPDEKWKDRFESGSPYWHPWYHW